MGISITRIVKFIRKGKGVIIAQSSNVFSYIESAWKLYYSTNGRIISWSGITNAADFTKGDTIVIMGVVSDKGNIPISLYAEVNSVDIANNVVTASSRYYIMNGKDGEPGVKGERGAVMRGPQAWSDCAVGYNFQSGADGEEFKDVVMYGNNYYSCIKSHTKTESNNPTSTIDTNNGYWKLADKFELVATKILLAQYALVKNLGVEAIDMKDSAGNIIFQAKDGNVICNSGTFKNGTFQNVKIIGSLRNPFTYAGSSMDTNYNDNVAMISYGGGWMTSYSLPWDVSQNGRKLSIVNYRWGSETAEGQAAIDAPSGKYFFEDGLQKTRLRISREIIELIGYGTSTEFYGWIVVNRIDLMPTQRYGHCLKVLAYGTCAGSDTTAKTSLVYTTFDGSKLSVTRQSTGIYRITYPSTWFNGTSSNCRVIPTGRGNILNGSNPIKANLHSIGTNYFEVSVSDDESRNDGSFDFIVYNGSDFDIL